MRPAPSLDYRNGSRMTLTSGMSGRRGSGRLATSTDRQLKQPEGHELLEAVD
jgi:hypothetical protein